MKTDDDLSNLDVVAASEKGFEIPLYHPGTTADLGWWIRVLGRDSAEFRQCQSEQNRKRMNKLSKGGRTTGASLQEIVTETVELLAACTVDWGRVAKTLDGVSIPAKSTLLDNGEELPCTRMNAITIYTKYPWIREQVDAGVGDRANFLVT